MADINDKRLLSSIHSAVTPRKQFTPTLPTVSRQQSVKIHAHRRKTNSVRLITVIHTKVRPQSSSILENKSENTNDNDTFPSTTDLINASHHRHNSTSLANQSLNEWSNNTIQSADINPRYRSLSQSSYDHQRQIKSVTLLNTHRDRKTKILKKLSSKSDKVFPYHDDISRGSIQFNSSSKTKLSDGFTSRIGSADELHDIVEHTKKRKKRKRFYCSPCKLFCLPCLLLTGLILGTLLTVLLLEFLPKSTTTIKTSSSISTTSSVATTSITTTSTTTVTSTITTTTIHYVCNSSCVNQSWTSSSNLLAEWQFDNNLLEDVTGTIPSTAPIFTYTTGYVNQALVFNATDNQSLTSPSMSLASTSFTIDAWIYPTGFPNSQDHSIVGLCPYLTFSECMYLTIRKNGSNCYLYFGFYGDECPGNTYVSVNEWIHVAFVFETNSLTQSIYLNGKLDVSRTAAGPFKANPETLTIGNIPVLDSLSGSNYFQGIIDRLAITGRDKSACEILEEASLAAYFTFDSGISFTDSGPNSLSAVGQSVSFTSNGHSLQAISFNGSTSSYFQISDVTGLGITNRPFTISFWIRPQSLSGTLVHVSANSSGLGWCIPFLGFAANGSIIAQMLNGIIRYVIGPSIPLAPTWTHIVETWGPVNGLRLYIDNVLVASTTSMANSYTASTVPNYVTLGNSLSGASICNGGLLGSMSPFNGDMDEFRIYSRELTADDICTLYTS
ncbi:unnamed protein product [Rotaria sp. Silwood1]|nr:unnamed protein product [Rotaria sp. Silwood1]CAF1642326.1 unnamed protein product [Rotaria sp. Silwood1]